MMKFEKSCGAVVFTRDGGEVRYVLVQALGGHYGFPKGHVEPGETERETALREIAEEVRLIPELLDGFREISEYDLPGGEAHKQVVFFLGEYHGQEIVHQEAELRAGLLASYDEAMGLLTHEDSRRILRRAHEFLSDLPEAWRVIRE